MKHYLTQFLAIIWLCFLPLNTHAQGFLSASPAAKAEVSLISSVSSIAPGETFEAIIAVKHPGNWYSYYFNPGGFSQPLEFKLTLPDGYTSSAIQWPVPEVKWTYGQQNFIHKKTAYFFTTITVPAQATAGQTVTLGSEVTIQLCNPTSCLAPSTMKAEQAIQIGNTELNPSATEIFTAARKTLPAETDWGFTMKQEEGNLLLNITTNADLSKTEKPVFIPNLPKIVDTKKKQSLTKTENGYLLTATLKKETTLPDNFSGVLTSQSYELGEHHGVLVSTTSKPVSSISSAAAAAETSVDAELKEEDQSEPSEEKAQPTKSANEHDSNDAISDDPLYYYLNYDTQKDIEEMADFESSDPIHTLSISQINDDGEVIDEQGAVIPKGTWSLDEKGNIVGSDGAVLNEKKELTLFWALLSIFAGGLILNLMPCVFPVLGVKVLGFVQLSGDDPAKIKKHGLVFTLGVILSMWVLTGALLAVRAITGDAIAWGSQMQNPFFVGCMIIVLTLFTLNLYGVFEVGTSLTSAGGNLQSKKGYQGSFFSGGLTTLIATPCGAPLLAPAMAYTLQQTALVAMILFTVFALGVAFPYLVLSFMPKLIHKLPKPGNWMVTFKKSMSFLLLATVVYLLTVFVDQTGNSGIKWMLWSLTIFATAAFIYGNWSSPYIAKTKRWIVGYGLALTFSVAGGYLGYQAMLKVADTHVAATADEDGWKPWRPGKVDHSRSKGRIVWVDYTAIW